MSLQSIQQICFSSSKFSFEKSPKRVTGHLTIGVLTTTLSPPALSPFDALTTRLFHHSAFSPLGALTTGSFSTQKMCLPFMLVNVGPFLENFKALFGIPILLWCFFPVPAWKHFFQFYYNITCFLWFLYLHTQTKMCYQFQAYSWVCIEALMDQIQT